MDAVASTEREEARAVVARLGLTGRLPRRRSTGSRARRNPPCVSPRSVGRSSWRRRRTPCAPPPIPSSTGAGRAVSDSSMIREPPAAAAERFLARVEELVAAENLTDSSRTKGVAVFAMTTLGLPEGVDEGPALAAFLTRAEELVRRREMSVTLARTSGGLGSRDFPPAAIFGPALGRSHRRFRPAGLGGSRCVRGSPMSDCSQSRCADCPGRGRNPVPRPPAVERGPADHADGDSRGAEAEDASASKWRLSAMYSAKEIWRRARTAPACFRVSIWYVRRSSETERAPSRERSATIGAAASGWSVKLGRGGGTGRIGSPPAAEVLHETRVLDRGELALVAQEVEEDPLAGVVRVDELRQLPVRPERRRCREGSPHERVEVGPQSVEGLAQLARGGRAVLRALEPGGKANAPAAGDRSERALDSELDLSAAKGHADGRTRAEKTYARNGTGRRRGER